MVHVVTARLTGPRPRGRTRGRRCVAGLTALVWMATFAAVPARAQQAPAEADTRAAGIVAQQREKAARLAPYEPNAAEIWVKKLEEQFITGNMRWHPFFTSAQSGGGFTLGAGYLAPVGDYDTLDLRGSYTFSNYKRIESEFIAPRLFNRRGRLSLLGGWREAPSVNFFGIGNETSEDAQVSYGFRQPYGAALLEVRPRRGPLLVAGGVEISQWDQFPGEGDFPSVDEVYTPATLNGLGATVTYLHTQGTVGYDWRPGPGYARRGGFYGVTVHHFADTDGAFTFDQVDYEAIQHIPVLRDAWVISLRGRVETTMRGDDDQVPFFMLPGLGGGSNLRGYSNLRFRDRHSLLMQAEWRVLVNSFIDTAVFFDAGKVAARKSDLDFNDLKTDVGISIRLHGPLATPLRIEIAKGNEGLHLIFAASATF